MNKKKEMWIELLAFIILSAVVFYFSFVEDQKGLSISLFGSFLTLLIGLIVTSLDFLIKLKNYGLWVETILELIITNVMFFVIMIPILTVSMSTYLAFSITYTIVRCLITFKADNPS